MEWSQGGEASVPIMGEEVCRYNTKEGSEEERWELDTLQRQPRGHSGAAGGIVTSIT